MNARKAPPRSGVGHALSGAAVQAILAGLLLGSTFLGASVVAWYLFRTALAGAGVWLYELLLSWRAHRAQPREQAPAAVEQAEPTASPRRWWRLPIRRVACKRFARAVFELAVCATYAYGAYPLFAGPGDLSSMSAAQVLPLVALYAFCAFAATVAAVYFLRLSRSVSVHRLRCPALHLGGLALLFMVALADALLVNFGVHRLRAALRPIIPLYNCVLAVEILAALVLRPLLPHRSGESRREAFNSYFLEMLLHPSRIGATMRTMLQGMLGFDASSTTVYRFVRRLAAPFVVLSALLLVALSSVVIVGPGKQAVLVRFGRIVGPVRGAGMHLKAPWPVGGVRICDTDSVRCIHVGSHRPESPGAEVFREGVPLLWTNLHGLRGEELLIVASPQRLIHSAIESGGKLDPTRDRAPSISLAGADIIVEFIIADVRSYLTSYNDPQARLRVLSEAHVSAHVLRYEIDHLFSERRVRMAEELRAAIQASCDSCALGLEILHVGIAAVHPPLEVADAFEENVSARQDRETAMQQARQKAVRSQVEAAGSVDDFEEIIALIEGRERDGGGSDAEIEERLLTCGGEVSRLLAAAAGYRWSRADYEGGNAERFVQELRVYRAAPRLYRYERYLSVLAGSLAQKRKTVLTGGHRDAVVGLGTGARWSIDALPEPTNEY